MNDGDGEKTAAEAARAADYQNADRAADNYQLSILNSQLSESETAFSLRLKTLDLMSKLSTLPIYELHCTISQQAVDLTLAALRENTPG